MKQVANFIASRRIHKSQGERRATWLELFFDLITVVAISRLGIYLHSDHSLTGVLTFFGLLVTVWWVWISYSYLSDIFDNDSTFDRLVQLFGMAGIAVMAITLPGSEMSNPMLFAAANVGLFGFLAFVYFLSGRAEPRARELCRWYVAGSSIGAGLWALSLLLDPPFQYYLWASAVVANAIISGPLAYAHMRRAPQQASHMPERFGLFLLIVLGEVILATINGIAHITIDSVGVVVGISGFVIAAAIWWLYFDHFDGNLITKAIRYGSSAQVRSFIYGYGHLLIYAAIVVLGVGIELAIEHAGEHTSSGSQPLIGIGAAGVLCGFILISVGTGRAAHRLFVILKLGITFLGLTCAVFGVNDTATCLLLATSLIALIVTESMLQPRSKEESEFE